MHHSLRTFCSIIFFICCAALVSAQFITAKACALCLAQQAIYVFIGVMSFLAIVQPKTWKLAGIGGGFMVLALTAGYHSLVQFGILTDPCSRVSIGSVHEFLAALSAPSCAQITWCLLGLPVAIWNVALGLLGGIICFLWARFPHLNSLTQRD